MKLAARATAASDGKSAAGRKGARSRPRRMWAAEPAAEAESDVPREIPASRQTTRGGGAKYEEHPGARNADELECRSLKADIVAAIA